MTSQPMPDLVHGVNAEQAQAAAPPQPTDSMTAAPSLIVKDRDMRELILCAAEASEIAVALSFAALIFDPNARAARSGGCDVGLTRVKQRLEALILRLSNEPAVPSAPLPEA